MNMGKGSKTFRRWTAIALSAVLVMSLAEPVGISVKAAPAADFQTTKEADEISEGEIPVSELQAAEDVQPVREGEELPAGVQKIQDAVHEDYAVYGKELARDMETGTVTIGYYATGTDAGAGTGELYRIVYQVDNMSAPTSFKATDYVDLNSGNSSAGTETYKVVIPAAVAWNGTDCPVVELCYEKTGNGGDSYVGFFDTCSGQSKYNYAITYLGVEAGSQLQTIGDYCCWHCENLTEVQLPDTVTSIGQYAFSTCGKLTKFGSDQTGELKLPAALGTIGYNTFSYLDGFSEVVIPAHLTKSGTRAFQGCNNLHTVRFAEGCDVICDNLFYKDTNSSKQFTELVIPATVKTIGQNAFRWQEALKTITFEEGSCLESIGAHAFRTCTALETVMLPDTVKTIGDAAFSGTDFTRMNSTEEGHMILPANLQTLGSSAFWGNDAITYLWIPKTVTTSGAPVNGTAFKQMCNLTEVVIEEGMQIMPQALLGDAFMIGENAGEEWEEVHVTLPASLTELKQDAFCNSVRLKSIALPANLTRIRVGAFKGCQNLEEIVIPGSVTRVDEAAFNNCGKLEKVIFETPDTTMKEQVLDEKVFGSCAKLTEVELSNKVKTIPASAFLNCTALTEIEIPSSVTEIKKGAFSGCENLRELYIPSSVTTFSTTSDEFAAVYSEKPKVYVEKGDSVAKTVAESYDWDVETGIYVVEEEFPNRKVREALLTQGIDRNQDARLTLREIRNAKELDLSGLGLEDGDLAGLQLLTGLEKLDCSGNQFTELPLEELVNLKELDCSDNQLTELSTEELVNLKSLNCSNNELMELDLSKNPLEKLDCSGNHILALDLSKVKTLTEVQIGSQTAEMALELNEDYDEYILPLKDDYAVFDKNLVSAINDADAKTVPEGLCWTAPEEVPDEVGYEYKAAYGSAGQSATGEMKIAITNAGRALTRADYPDGNLRKKLMDILDTNGNGLVSKTEEKACKVLDVSNAGISSLQGIGQLKALEELDCSSNKLTKLDLSGLTALKALSCENNALETMKLSDLTALETLNCENNALKALDLAANVELKEIKLAYNMLESLDISKLVKLETIECGNNRLAAFDCSENTALGTIRLGKQEIQMIPEEADGQQAVRLKEYDAGFDWTKVYSETVYNATGEALPEEDVQLDEEGYLLPASASKIVYEYRPKGSNKLTVTVHLVSSIVEVTGVTLDRQSIESTAIGEKITLTATVAPEDALNKTVTFTTSNEGVATVTDEGVVTITGYGTAVITVTTQENRKTAVCNVSVTREAVAVTGVTLDRESIESTAIGEKITLTATVAPEDADNKKVSYASSNAEVATVTDKGEVTITGYGTAVITVTTEDGGKTAECTVKVTEPEGGQNPGGDPNPGGDLNPGGDPNPGGDSNPETDPVIVNVTGVALDRKQIESSKIGERIALTATVTPENAQNKKVNYTSSDEAVATVTSEGVVTITGYGTAVITVTTEDGQKTDTCAITVTKEADTYSLYDEAVRIDLQKTGGKIAAINGVAYTGSRQTPKIKVTVNLDGKTVSLSEGSDYRIEYGENINVSTGGKVTVIGINDYRGTLSEDFAILPKQAKKLKIVTGDMAKDDMATELPIEVFDGTRLLKRDVDYKVDESARAVMVGKAGTAKFNITGLGNYTDAAVAKIKIVDTKGKILITSRDVALTETEAVYNNGKAVTLSGITVTVDGKPLDGKTDYKVQYQNNKNVGTACLVITGKGKTYTGKVVKTFTIMPKRSGSMSFESIIVNKGKELPYNGKLQQPKAVVKLDGKTLALNRDYVLEYSRHLNAGTAQVKVIGIGNYAGISGSKSFQITRQAVKKISVKALPKNNSFTLIYNKKTLVKGVDYRLEIVGENKNKLDVKITGLGNFEGEKTVKADSSLRAVIEK